MKPIEYEGNGNGLYVQYHRMKEGPNYFLIHYKNSSVLRQDPKDCWRVMKVAKFTAQAQELKQWCIDIHNQYSNTVKEVRKDTSFSTEVQAEPTDNTKMIV